MKTNKVKNTMLFLMAVLLTIGLHHADGDIKKMGFILF